MWSTIALQELTSEVRQCSNEQRRASVGQRQLDEASQSQMNHSMSEECIILKYSTALFQHIKIVLNGYGSSSPSNAYKKHN